MTNFFKVYHCIKVYKNEGEKIMRNRTAVQNEVHVNNDDTYIGNRSNFYSANIPSIARLSGTTAESVFKSKIDKAVP